MDDVNITVNMPPDIDITVSQPPDIEMTVATPPELQTSYTQGGDVTITAPPQPSVDIEVTTPPEVNIDSIGGVKGDTGPANELTIGTVTRGTTADATITGQAPRQELSLVLPQGDKGDKGDKGDIGATGPANSLDIGTVQKGVNADATITGTAPSQTLNLTLPKGDKGDTGATGAAGPSNSLSIGTVTTGPSDATITGTSPNQTLNLTLEKGEKGDTGAQGVKGDTGAGVPSGGTTGQIIKKTSGGTAWSSDYALPGDIPTNNTQLTNGAGYIDKTSNETISGDKTYTGTVDFSGASGFKIPVIQLNASKTAVGINKVPEQGDLDVEGDIYSNGEKVLTDSDGSDWLPENKIYIAEHTFTGTGSVVISGFNFIPSKITAFPYINDVNTDMVSVNGIAVRTNSGSIVQYGSQGTMNGTRRGLSLVVGVRPSTMNIEMRATVTSMSVGSFTLDVTSYWSGLNTWVFIVER